MRVFYAPTAQYTPRIDLVDESTGRGLHSNMTKEELEAEHGTIEILDDVEACRRIEAAHTTAPKEVDEERFMYLLEVLPPCKWRRIGDRECFHVSERVTLSIVTWGVRLGDRYFTLDATDKLKADEVFSLVEAAFPRKVTT